MYSVGLFVMVLSTLGSTWTPQPARSFATTSMRAWATIEAMPSHPEPPDPFYP